MSKDGYRTAAERLRAEADIMLLIGSVPRPGMVSAIAQLRTHGFGVLADELDVVRCSWDDIVRDHAGKHARGVAERPALKPVVRAPRRRVAARPKPELRVVPKDEREHGGDCA